MLLLGAVARGMKMRVLDPNPAVGLPCIQCGAQQPAGCHYRTIRQARMFTQHYVTSLNPCIRPDGVEVFVAKVCTCTYSG